MANNQLYLFLSYYFKCTDYDVNRAVNDALSHYPFQAMISNLEQLQCQGNGTCNFHYPCTFTTNADEKDTLHDGDMLHSLDRLCFAEALLTEMEGLQDMLEIVLRAQAPAHVKTLPAVWAFN
jgi:hypothetical protein